MTKHTTFVEKITKGLNVDIDDEIEIWHESDSDLELHEWLGLTWEEYCLFGKNPDALEKILEDRSTHLKESGLPEYEEISSEYYESLCAQNKQSFLKSIGIPNIEERDISTGPYYHQTKVRSLRFWEKLKFSDLSKIKDFLKAKEVFIETFYSDERGQEPITVTFVYHDDDEKTLKWLGL